MPALDLTSFQPMLKSLYAKGFEQAVYKKNPAWARLKKWTAFGGEDFRQPVRYGATAGTSVTFARAQANKAASRQVRFVMTRVDRFGLASLKGNVISAASHGEDVAVASALKAETDAMFYAFGRAMAADIWGNRGGALGRIASGQGTATITLTNRQDVVNFEVGMVVETASTDGTSGAVNVGRLTISAVNRTTGTLTTAGGNWNVQIPACAANDYIFRDGDFAAVNSVIAGFRAWCPDAAPGATAFFGVDRTADSRLGGQRYNATGVPIEEALIEGVTRAYVEGADPDEAYLNPTNWAALVKAVGSKSIVDVTVDKPKVGFKAVQLMGQSGPVNVLADPNCPVNRCIATEMGGWTLGSSEEAPHYLMDDKQRLLREAGDDAYEIRIGSYAQMWPDNPNNTMNIQLA